MSPGFWSSYDKKYIFLMRFSNVYVHQNFRFNGILSTFVTLFKYLYFLKHGIEDKCTTWKDQIPERNFLPWFIIRRFLHNPFLFLFCKQNVESDWGLQVKTDCFWSFSSMYNIVCLSDLGKTCWLTRVVSAVIGLN